MFRLNLVKPEYLVIGSRWCIITGKLHPKIMIGNELIKVTKAPEVHVDQLS